MPDYKAMYYHLAGKVADVIDILIKTQQENEEDSMINDLILKFPNDENEN